MNHTLKTILWIGAIIVVPGLGVALLAKKIYTETDENSKFKEYVRKTYGKASNYVERT